MYDRIQDAQETLNSTGVQSAYTNLMQNTAITPSQLAVAQFHTDKLLNVGVPETEVAGMLEKYVNDDARTGTRYFHALGFAQEALKAYEWQSERLQGTQAEATIDETVEPNTIKMSDYRPSVKEGLAAAAAIAMGVTLLGANNAKADFYDSPTTDYTWSITQNGQVAPNLWSYTGHLHNQSTGGFDDSGGLLEIFGQDIKNPVSYFGGTIGDFRETIFLGSDTINPNLDLLMADITSPLGRIDPTTIDPSADDLFINFLSDYSTLVNTGEIHISTVANGIYGIEDAEMPGAVVPLPSAVLLGALGLGAVGLNKRKLKK